MGQCYRVLAACPAHRQLSLPHGEDDDWRAANHCDTRRSVRSGWRDSRNHHLRRSERRTENLQQRFQTDSIGDRAHHRGPPCPDLRTGGLPHLYKAIRCRRLAGLEPQRDQDSDTSSNRHRLHHPADSPHHIRIAREVSDTDRILTCTRCIAIGCGDASHQVAGDRSAITSGARTHAHTGRGSRKATTPHHRNRWCRMETARAADQIRTASESRIAHRARIVRRHESALATVLVHDSVECNHHRAPARRSWSLWRSSHRRARTSRIPGATRHRSAAGTGLGDRVRACVWPFCKSRTARTLSSQTPAGVGDAR